MARALLLTAVAFGTAVAAGSAAAQPGVSTSADRYGPGLVAAPPPAVVPASAPIMRAALHGRVLAWPGKVEHPFMMAVAPSPAAAAAAAAWRNVPETPVGLRPVARQPSYRAPSQPAAWTPPARMAYAPSQTPPRVSAAPSAQAPAAPPAPALAGTPARGWRPVFANPAPTSAQAVAPPRPAAPTTRPAYPAAFATPPNRAMAGDHRYGYDPTQSHAVRFYSVARPFGVQPDPAPIPPQFFTASADLSAGDPPGPLPVSHTTATTRAAVVGGSDASAQ